LLSTSAHARALSRSEEDEDFTYIALDVLLFLTDHVEADGLGEGSALTDSHDVADLDAERRGAVGGERFVALFESVVLLDVVQVIASDDDSALHLGRNDDAPERS